MIIVDIEASGLGDESYPIEIAWAERGQPSIGNSFLIRPAVGWTHWDPYAENHIHGISRAVLQEHGISVQSAVRCLNKALGGKTVYSDHVESDRPWLVRLYREVGENLTFRLGHVQSLIPPDKLGVYYHRFSATPTVHRALPDVEKIIRTLNFMAPF